MNIYFLISVFDANFEYLAQCIRRDYPESRFYGFAYNRTPALRSEIFSGIDFASDMNHSDAGEPVTAFLSRIEREFDVLASELIHLDRHSLRYPKQKRPTIARNYIEAFTKSMADHQIEMVISEGVDDLVSLFAMKYCDKKGIPFVAPMPGRQGNAAILCERDDTEPVDFRRDLEAARAEPGDASIAAAGRNYIEQSIEKQTRPHYTTSGSLIYRVLSPKDVVIGWNYLRQFFSDRGHHHNVHPFSLPGRRLRRIYRKRCYRRFLRKTALKVSELPPQRYFVYPIHFHPESATLIMGRRFHHQIEYVKAISQSLPSGYQLVVKEHRVNLGRQPLEFYRAISDFHNVQLVSEETNVYELLRNSAGIVTISSSMALEALMLGKPVLTAGTPYYNLSKNVYHCLDFEGFPAAILQMLRHEFDDWDNQLFFGVLSRHLIECGNITQFYGVNREAWDRLYDRINERYLRRLDDHRSVPGVTEQPAPSATVLAEANTARTAT